jgi:hypothetical protein
MKDKRRCCITLSEDTDKQIEYLKDMVSVRQPKEHKRSATIAMCVEKVYNECSKQ